MRKLRAGTFLAAALAALLAAGRLHADAFDSIAKDLSGGAKRLSRNKIAILPFPYHDGRTTQGSGVIAERLVAAFSKRKKLEVIERGMIERVLREVSFRPAGMMEQESVRQIGRVLGVEAVVIGTLIDLDEDSVEINARLVSAENGEVLEASRQDVRRMWKEAQPKRTFEPPPNPADAGDALSPPAPSPSADSASSGDLEAVPEELQAEPLKPSLRPHSPVVLDTRGQARLGEDDYALLETLFAAEMNRAREASQLYDGLRVLRSGDSSRALGIFSLLERRYKKLPRLRALSRLGLSLCHFDQGRKGSAIGSARSVAGLEEYPSISAAAHYVLARYDEIFGRTKQARRNYLEILRISPFQTPIVKAASTRYARMGSSGEFLSED